MLQPSTKPFSARSILLILFVLPLNTAVKPVWRTPVTNVRKNATARTQRASNSAPQEEYAGFQKQTPYYTRAEDFKIPDYRPPKPNVPNGVNSDLVPQFAQPRQPFVGQQFIQNYPPLNGGNVLSVPPPHLQQVLNGPQPPNVPHYAQFPNGLTYRNPGPGFIPVVPVQNNGQQQWIVPPNAIPYWEGPGPVPPQGVYGPTTTTVSTHEPMKPSVNPENYKGALPTQPSANPELYTTVKNPPVSPVTDLVQPHPTQGWYNPLSTPAHQPVHSTASTIAEKVEETSSAGAIFETETNPFTEPSTLVTAEETSRPTSTSPTTKPTVLLIEDITKGWEDFEELATAPTTSRSSLYGTPEPSDDIYDHADIVHDVEEGTSTTVTSTIGELEQARTSYFPRPASSQVFQPPGHLPEDFTQHIDVNFLKPNRSCSGPLCGVDADKVSLYNPGKVDGSRGPTLLISNAAKGDAARLGYIPPSPKLISEFTAPPSTTEYYNNKFIPDVNYQPKETPGPFQKGELSTPEPFRPEIPKGPHVFMPPQHFPAPPSPTEVPPAAQTREVTTVPSYSPTAKTIAPPPTTAPYTTEFTTTEATTSPSTIAYRFENTLPPFETTAKSSEGTTEVFTASTQSVESQPPEEDQYTTPPSFQPWSPTYKTVPTTSYPTLRSEVPTTPPTPAWIPPSEVPTTPSAVHVSRPYESERSTRFETSTEGITRATTESTTSSSLTTKATTTSRFITEFSTTRERTEATTTEYFTITTPTRPPAAHLPPSTPAPPLTTTVEETTVPLRPTTSRAEVMNRVRGKVHVVCKEEGIEFSATTLFPFTGQIFANERKRVPSCVHTIVDAITPKVFLPFDKCGVKNAGDQADNRSQYHMQVVLVIQQADGTTTVQSFMAQCVHQKIQYNKQTLPRRIEEALEELRLVATKLEQKAPLPQVEMKIVVDEHHNPGPEVSEVDIGMPLLVQWKLLPESDAYGFHVRNCIVRDDISGIEHKMIDELGCSTDLSIFAHPHYDTYHDTASTHLWAFKVPDHTRLRLRCDVAICSDISSSTTNISSCASIPTVNSVSPLVDGHKVTSFLALTNLAMSEPGELSHKNGAWLAFVIKPPFCPDLITSPSNSILYDAEGALLKRRRQISTEMTQSVRAALCTGGACDPEALALDRKCFDLYWVAASTGFSFASLIAAIVIHVVVRVKISRQQY